MFRAPVERPEKPGRLPVVPRFNNEEFAVNVPAPVSTPLTTICPPSPIVGSVPSGSVQSLRTTCLEVFVKVTRLKVAPSQLTVFGGSANAWKSTVPSLSSKAAPLFTVKFPLTVSVPDGAVNSAVGISTRESASVTFSKESRPGDALAISKAPAWARVPVPESVPFRTVPPVPRSGPTPRGSVQSAPIVLRPLDSSKATRSNVLPPQASMNELAPSKLIVPSLASKLDSGESVKFLLNEAVPLGAVKLPLAVRLKAPPRANGSYSPKS